MFQKGVFSGHSIWIYTTKKKEKKHRVKKIYIKEKVFQIKET